MSTINDSGYKAFTATAVAISKNVRVQLDGDGKISAAGATDDWIGTTVEDVAASGVGTVRLRNAPGTHFFTASAAVTRGALLYPTASGKVDDASGSGPFTGFEANEAATADGDIIEAVPTSHTNLTASADQTALTDNTGGSVSDATLADGLTLTAVTDNSTGTATDTIAAMTNTDALTDNTGGTASNTLADIEASYTEATIANNFASIAAELATQRTLNTAIINAVASLAAKVNTARTDLSTQNDNDAKIAELANALRTACVNAGIAKGSA